MNLAKQRIKSKLGKIIELINSNISVPVKTSTGLATWFMKGCPIRSVCSRLSVMEIRFIPQNSSHNQTFTLRHQRQNGASWPQSSMHFLAFQSTSPSPPISRTGSTKQYSSGFIRASFASGTNFATPKLPSLLCQKLLDGRSSCGFWASQSRGYSCKDG